MTRAATYLPPHSGDHRSGPAQRFFGRTALTDDGKGISGASRVMLAATILATSLDVTSLLARRDRSHRMIHMRQLHRAALALTITAIAACGSAQSTVSQT